jgi:tryptophan synthase alpha chain
MGLARLEESFEKLRLEGRSALMPYLTLGYPSLDLSVELAETCAEAGANVLELGIPFSDPIADGPIIQRATHLALEQGASPRMCLGAFQEIRQLGVEVPLVAMSYYNPIFHYGLGDFCRDLADAGGDGLIVPDLLPEEAGDLKAAAERQGLALIFLLAPTSTPERIGVIAQASSGFIYLVSLTGVTGPREELAEDLKDFVARVRRKAALPLCVGFGVSNPPQARTVAGIADGVIVGSAVVRLAGEGDDPTGRVRHFVASLREAMDGTSEVA